MAANSRRQFLVTVAPTQGGPTFPTKNFYFAQKTGGATQATLTKVFDGGALTPTVLPGVAETSDLVLTKPYDPNNDQALIKSLKPLVGRYFAQITVQPTDANLTPISGAQETYQGILSAVAPSDVDAGSSEAATFSITFTVSTVA